MSKEQEVEIKRETNPITLTRFLLAEQMRFLPKGSTGNFTILLQSIQLACKVIARAVQKAGIANLYGLAGASNTSGDVQKKLDVFANEVFINCLTFSEQVYIMASEEDEKPIILEEKSGGYAIVFDPLDGSSNIDANVSIGTIFGIYRKETHEHKTSEKDVLKPGRELVCAGYAVYGASVMIVLTTGNGVNGFTLDATIGEFILTHPNIRIPRRGNYYSINEANSKSWDLPTKLYIERCKQKQKNGKPKTARYIGSMVADVHRTLLYGGIFCYPADEKNKNGKLRLLYECNPISYIIEQAGGKSSTGRQRILDIQPEKVHQRVPIFCGSYDDVSEVEELYAQYDAGLLKAPEPQVKAKL